MKIIIEYDQNDNVAELRKTRMDIAEFLDYRIELVLKEVESCQ